MRTFVLLVGAALKPLSTALEMQTSDAIRWGGVLAFQEHLSFWGPTRKGPAFQSRMHSMPAPAPAGGEQEILSLGFYLSNLDRGKLRG